MRRRILISRLSSGLAVEGDAIVGDEIEDPLPSCLLVGIDGETRDEGGVARAVLGERVGVESRADMAVVSC